MFSTKILFLKQYLVYISILCHFIKLHVVIYHQINQNFIFSRLVLRLYRGSVIFLMYTFSSEKHFAIFQIFLIMRFWRYVMNFFIVK